MMERRVTLKDLAQRLGLSVAAVSKALHHDKGISAPQRDRVQKLAQEMGYRPDPGLSALAAYRIKSGHRPSFAPIVFLALSPLGPNWVSAFYYGVERQARLLGYELSYYYLSPDLSMPRHSQILFSRGVRGIILAPLPYGTTTLDLDWDKFSVVVLGSTLAQPAFNRVTTDSVGALVLALDHVHRQGYERIGVAIPKERDIQAAWSWTSAVAVAKQQMHHWNEKVVFYLGSENHPLRFLSWLKKQQPRVVISLTHPMQDWIAAAGYRIPEEIALVTLDYHAHALLVCPGTDQNFDAVGVAGMTLLHSSLIQGERGAPRFRLTLLVQPSWVDQPLAC